MAEKEIRRIPFCPLPVDKAERVSRRFGWLAEKFSVVMPNLGATLEHARMPFDKITYLSLSIFSAAFISSLVFILILALSYNMVEPLRALLISLSVGIVMFFVVIAYLAAYPRLIVKKHVNDIERNIISALKHMLIQIKSGIPLFDSLAYLSEGEYGALSDELKILVKDVNAGTSIEDALDSLAVRNPSQSLRKLVWQISNAMKAGSNIGTTLKGIVDNASKEQLVAIRRYGSQLNPLTLVYMMIAVIIPALGVTLLIVMSSFSKIPITETTFIVILLAVAFLQFMYMGIIKSRRPNT